VTPAARSARSALALLALGLAANAPAQDAAPVARILTERCAVCHQGEAAPLGLRLDSIDALLAGGRNGAAVKPGDPAASELMRRIRGQSLPRMPLTGPPFLSDAEASAIERWIAAGAPRAPAGAGAAPRARRARAAGDPVTYEDIQPILGARCAKCHTDNGLRGAPPEGYRLNDYANTLASADRARVVPGQPAASELVRRISGQSLPRMPFDGPPYLSAEEIALVERWVAQGARNAAGRAAGVPAGAKVRLGGTLRGENQLDDLHFEWQGRGRARAAAGVVELRGSVGADGRILAERIRYR
jgi:mono/diheme cytochrome c family protein